MSNVPPLRELEAAARDIVRKAKADDRLHEITPIGVRREVERQFDLEENVLEDPGYKGSLRKVTKETAEEENAVEEEKEPIPRPASKVKPSSSKSRGMKRKSEEAVLSENDEDEEKAKSLRKQFKSRDTIVDSDDEDATPVPGNDAGSTKENDSAKDVKPNKKRKSATGEASKSSKAAKVKRSPSEEADEPSTKEADDVGPKCLRLAADMLTRRNLQKTDSELSVLIDEPPKRKRKSSTKERGKAGEKGKAARARKSGGELSKDEETIKRLKSFVVACGVRKVWSKVFKDANADKPADQIRVLRKMLADLGMTGRLSLEQAKTIKEKRELAQELEDVQEFAAKMNGRSSRSASKKAKAVKAASSDEERDASDDDKIISDEEAVPAKKRTAARSIMAFLADQSDDE
ncbi:hypothetical protein HDZ31DRAFT_80165 [Schizophyllum fasciatum]